VIEQLQASSLFSFPISLALSSAPSLALSFALPTSFLIYFPLSQLVLQQHPMELLAL